MVIERTGEHVLLESCVPELQTPHKSMSNNTAERLQLECKKSAQSTLQLVVSAAFSRFLQYLLVR